MSRFTLKLLGSLLAAGALSIACSDSEAPSEDHTPASLQIDGVAVDTADTVGFTAGVTDTVQLSFFNAANDNLDDVEPTHFSSFTFTPSTSIAATTLAAHHFQQEVIIGAVSGQTGDLAVGFGHDALADEHSFTLHYKVQ